jgi:hypothetical protein
VGNTTWDNLLDPFPIARGAAFASFTTAQDISPVPLKYTYGNELKIGSVMEIEAWGEYSSVTTPTMRLGFAYGITTPGGLLSTGVELAGVALTANTGTPVSWPWHMDWSGIVTADGATGVIYGQGILDLGSSLTVMGGGGTMPVTAAARSVTIDTTLKKTWHVFGAWGVSSASNILRCDIFTVKVLNQGKTAQ